jgi:transcription elongation factor Elf1
VGEGESLIATASVPRAGLEPARPFGHEPLELAWLPLHHLGQRPHSTREPMRIFRCPRCRAEDISADAHPTRVLDNGVERPVFVCRNCYRAAELEFRIASQTADLGYVPLAIRDGLRLLRDFYRERLADEEDDGDPRIRSALAEVERRLAIDAV